VLPTVRANSVLRPKYSPTDNPSQPSIFTDAKIFTPYDTFPNFCASPNIWSIGDGLWSSTGTWNLGRIPTTGDVVAILGNVTYDVSSTAAITCISIQNLSKLQFVTNANTKLVVQQLMVLNGGELRIGDDVTPVDAANTAEVVFPDVAIAGNDPSSTGNGLLCFGKWTMCGCGGTLPKTFIRLTVDPLIGHTTLTLADPATGWKVGDTIVLPDSHQLDWFEKYPNFASYVSQIETRTITAISPDKLTLTLNSALTYNHKGCKVDGVTVQFAHVALLTRNIKWYSANPAGVRGHTLATMTADVDICHAMFTDMGRTRNEDEVDNTTFNPDGSVLHVGTNQIGRYPIHIHHAHGSMTDPEMTHRYMLDGLSIINSSKWAITLHHAHYGLVTNNVMYNSGGAGLACEDGSESYNEIDGNFVCKVTGTGSRDNSGRDGIGLWFRGPNNYIRNNVATNVILALTAMVCLSLRLSCGLSTYQ
jgi:hypothetical protein